jgi:proteasome-associated ATPase
MPQNRDIDRDLLRAILAVGEGAPSIEEKAEMLRQYRGRGERLGPADRELAGRIAQLGNGLTEAQQMHADFRRMMDELLEPPWYPAILAQVLPGTEGFRRILVHQGGSSRVVGVGGDVDLDGLSPGDEIYLGKEQNIVVGRSPERYPRCGETGIFERWTADGRLVVKTRDEEVVVKAAGSLIASGDLRSGDQVRFDRSVWFAFEKVERSQGSHFFLEDTPTETFDGIGGLTPQIMRMQRSILLRLRHAATAARYGVHSPRSMLLVGPPGVGKTMMARALCNWLSTETGSGRALFMNLKPGSLHSMWYAQTEANYREAFRVAREAGAANPDVPVCVFVDEVDSVGALRGNSTSRVDDRVLAAFLAELDGLEGRGNVLVVAATNRREACDPALLRHGRLGDNVIEVPRPNMAAARSIFEKHLDACWPYAENGAAGAAARALVIDTVVSHLYAPNGDNGLATLVFRGGKRWPVRVPDMISGATIAGIARQATERACAREVETGEAGIRAGDLLAVAGEQCAIAARVLTPRNCREHLSGLRDDEDVVSVVLASRKVAYPQAYLRAV